MYYVTKKLCKTIASGFCNKKPVQIEINKNDFSNLIYNNLLESWILRIPLNIRGLVGFISLETIPF